MQRRKTRGKGNRRPPGLLPVLEVRAPHMSTVGTARMQVITVVGLRGFGLSLQGQFWLGLQTRDKLTCSTKSQVKSFELEFWHLRVFLRMKKQPSTGNMPGKPQARQACCTKQAPGSKGTEISAAPPKAAPAHLRCLRLELFHLRLQLCRCPGSILQCSRIRLVEFCSSLVEHATAFSRKGHRSCCRIRPVPEAEGAR